MFDELTKNIGTLTENEADTLTKCTVAIVGCGGLGGRNAELLCRMGFGKLILIDDDEFSLSNLNRQLFSNRETIGKKKVEVLKAELQKINPKIDIEIKEVRLNEKNAYELLFGANIVVDALDNIESRLELENAAENLKIPLVHGAVGGLCGEVAVVFPNQNILQRLYENGVKSEMSSTIAPTVGVVSSLQSVLTAMVVLEKFDKNAENLFLVDLKKMSFEKWKI